MQSTSKKTTIDPMAYELYLKGLYAGHKPIREAQEEAIRLFESATKMDPKFSFPYSAWSNVLVLMGGVHVPFREIYPKAKELVTRALELDPKSSEAHMTLGNLALQCELDWKKAETEFQKAIALNPGNVDAHFWYGILLTVLQRFDEAKEEFRETIRLNPMSFHGWHYLTIVLALSGEVNEAVRLAEDVRNMEPTSFTNQMLLGYTYVQAARMMDAMKVIESLAGPRDLGDRVGRASLLAFLGKTSEAVRLVKELEERRNVSYVPSLWMADLYAVLGEKEKALDVLERDFKDGDKNLWVDYQLPVYEWMRSEPRFVALLGRYKLAAEAEHLAAMPHPILAMKAERAGPT